MPIFTPKRIVSEKKSGQSLKEARSYRGLTLEEIGKKLQISPRYLEALEENDRASLPPGLYYKSYLKKYARFLNIDYRALVSQEKDGLTIETDDPFSQKIVKRSRFIIFPKILKNTLIILTLIICLLYLSFYIKKIFFAPKLIISQPEPTLVTSSSYITVIGKTEKEAAAAINNEIVLNNHEGNFQKELSLKKGLNNIVITAKKKYSRPTTIIRQILVQ